MEFFLYISRELYLDLNFDHQEIYLDTYFYLNDAEIPNNSLNLRTPVNLNIEER